MLGIYKYKFSLIVFKSKTEKGILLKIYINIYKYILYIYTLLQLQNVFLSLS